MANPSPIPDSSFSTTLPIQVLIRPVAPPGADWQEFDRGPGVFQIPAGHEASVRIRAIDNARLAQLIREIGGCRLLTSLNLSENRNITDEALASLKVMHQLTELNLSSCSISNRGLRELLALPELARLNLSYCNRITDEGLKRLKGLRRLAYLDIQGCVKITNGSVSKIRRQGLIIHWY